MPFGLQVELQALRQMRFVFHDQHAAHAGITLRGRSSRGKSSEAIPGYGRSFARARALGKHGRRACAHRAHDEQSQACALHLRERALLTR